MVNLKNLASLNNVYVVEDIHEEVKNNLILLYWPEKNLSQLVVKSKNNKEVIHQTIETFKGNKEKIFIHLLQTGIFKDGAVKVCSI